MTAPVRRLGANDIQPCPSESCRRAHLALGVEHDCQVNIPHPRRLEPPKLRRAA